MKYQVSLNGKQFEVEVEKGSVSAVLTGAAPAPAPAAAAPAPSVDAGDGFMNIPDGIDEELPFN